VKPHEETSYRSRSRDYRGRGSCHAHHGGCALEGGWWGPALGGFALGALVGSAFARPYYAYPAYGYGYPAYSYGYPAYSYGYPAYYGYGDRTYYGYYGARY
jgi:hypothetical protein